MDDFPRFVYGRPVVWVTFGDKETGCPGPTRCRPMVKSLMAKMVCASAGGRGDDYAKMAGVCLPPPKPVTIVGTLSGRQSADVDTGFSGTTCAGSQPNAAASARKIQFVVAIHAWRTTPSPGPSPASERPPPGDRRRGGPCRTPQVHHHFFAAAKRRKSFSLRAGLCGTQPARTERQPFAADPGQVGFHTGL